MNKTEAMRIVRNGVVSGLCSAGATIVTATLCNCIDHAVDNFKEKKEMKTLEEVFED